jgi:hypothetical protein
MSLYEQGIAREQWARCVVDTDTPMSDSELAARRADGQEIVFTERPVSKSGVRYWRYVLKRRGAVEYRGSHHA